MGALSCSEPETAGLKLLPSLPESSQMSLGTSIPAPANSFHRQQNWVEALRALCAHEAHHPWTPAWVISRPPPGSLLSDMGALLPLGATSMCCNVGVGWLQRSPGHTCSKAPCELHNPVLTCEQPGSARLPEAALSPAPAGEERPDRQL